MITLGDVIESSTGHVGDSNVEYRGDEGFMQLLRPHEPRPLVGLAGGLVSSLHRMALTELEACLEP